MSLAATAFGLEDACQTGIIAARNRGYGVPKQFNVAALSTEGLANLIKNSRDRGATDTAQYLDALREYEARRGLGLRFETSLEIIRAAAQSGRFISYKDLADASGLDWSKVRYAMNEHLGRLLEYAHRNNLPLLSSIVVNKENVSSGVMEPATLKGFVAAARDLGYVFLDDREFLADQQQRVFAWGRAVGAAAMESASARATSGGG